MKYELHFRTRSGSHYVWSPMYGALYKVSGFGERTLEVSEVETMERLDDGRLHFDGVRWHEGRQERRPYFVTTSPVVNEWHEPEPTLVGVR